MGCNTCVRKVAKLRTIADKNRTKELRQTRMAKLEAERVQRRGRHYKPYKYKYGLT